MNTRFNVDLIHPGSVVRNWYDWFIDRQGTRRLALFALGCAAILILGMAAILPMRLQLSTSLGALPGLRRDLEARQSDLTLLRANLGALTQEAKRQVRWAEVLTVLSHQIPPTLKLETIDSARTPPPPATPGPGGKPPAPPESTLRLRSVTPLRAGSQPLLDIAQFMAGLMKEPSVNRRFQLKSWDIKPAASSAQGAPQLLDVNIVLAERNQ